MNAICILLLLIIFLIIEMIAALSCANTFMNKSIDNNSLLSLIIAIFPIINIIYTIYALKKGYIKRYKISKKNILNITGRFKDFK